MKNEKITQLIACFIAAIVIFIPFYVSDVYAASLEITRMNGVDNVDGVGWQQTGFARSSDIVTVEVLASISDTEDVEPGKLRIYESTAVEISPSGYVYFNNCTRVSDGSPVFSCIYRRTYYNILESVFFRVDLHSGATQYDELASPLKSVSGMVSLDKYGAKVTEISVNPERSTTGETEITFSVEDYSWEDGVSLNCSGINRIEFYEGDYSGEPFTIIYPPIETCEYNNHFNYLADPTAYQVTICAIAYDNFEQSAGGSVCADFFVDSIPPEPDLASLRIVKTDTDEELEYIGQNDEVTDIFIDITAEDLVAGSVETDLSNLAGALFTSVSPTSHVQDNSTYTFKWKNVRIGSVDVCSITITAEDTLGNRGETSVPCSIVIDNDGPEVTGISTYAELEGVYYLGKTGTLVAHIAEGGIGLDKHQVFMDLTNIATNSWARADNCTSVDSSNWECYWYDVEPTAADGEYYVSIYKESKDDLDNIMAEKYEQIIGVDKTSPLINQDVELTIIPGVVEVPYEDITIAGDTLEFVIEVSDAYSATADFSSIGAGSNVSPSACWRENQSIFCLWEVMIAASGPYDADIAFDFTDFAGNHNTISKSVFVSGLIDEPNPNYWTHTVDCSPRYVDRLLTSLLSQKYYCHIKMSTSSNPDAELMSFSMSQYPLSCYALDNETEITNYINNILLINNNPGSTDPYLDAVLNVADFDMDNFEFACDFEIFTKIGDDYTLNPEIETVSVNMEFYNLPMGRMDEAYEDELDYAIDSVESIGEWFDQLSELFDTLTRACELYAMINNMLSAVTALGITFAIASDVTPDGAPIKELWMSTCKGEHAYKGTLFGLKSVFDPLCAFVNCKFSKDALKGLSGDTKKFFEGWASIGRGEYLGAGFGTDAEQGPLFSLAFDVKQSIVWSLMTLCVPGIIYNVKKMRQIHCQYADCILVNVPAGIPQYICEDTKAMQECQFFWGQIFNLIPFVQLWSNALNALKSYFSDPISAIAFIVNIAFACGGDCETGITWNYYVCAPLATLSMIGKAVGDVNAIQEMGWFDQVGNQACETFYDDLKDHEDDYEEGDEDNGEEEET